jgi:Spy/CpxP family protein refolding chaperone
VKKCKVPLRGGDRGPPLAILVAQEVPFMNARLAHVLSRLSIVSVVAVSALGAAACNSQASTTTPAPAETAQEAQAAPTEHAPGQRIFNQVLALDLRPAQRDAVSEIQQNLVADLSPHRETLRQVATFLASSIEAGQLDPADAAAHQAALEAAILDAKASFATAMNSLHDTLDADQRAALVAHLEEQHRRGYVRGQEGTAAAEDSQHDGPLAKLAFEIGLTEEQKANLREAVQKGADELFPNHKARREASEAKMKALADAFVSDDFDAADHDLGGGPERSLQSFAAAASRAVEVSGQILSVSQREALGSMIRSHAQKI